MAFNISESLLGRVRTAATRAKSHAYDDEIKTYIRACLYDLDRLNILFDEDDLEDEIVVAVITYVKSKLVQRMLHIKNQWLKHMRIYVRFL